jgi:hypothetical protein
MGSISPTLYIKYLHAQIPKAQKYGQAISLLVLLGSASVKAARKMFVKWSLGGVNRFSNYL